jgi:hypothetical protein
MIAFSPTATNDPWQRMAATTNEVTLFVERVVTRVRAWFEPVISAARALAESKDTRWDESLAWGAPVAAVGYEAPVPRAPSRTCSAASRWRARPP